MKLNLELIENLKRRFDVIVVPADQLPVHHPLREEDANVLICYHNGDKLMEHSDIIDPDDAKFTSGLSWVVEAIKQAYQLGLNDGYEKSASKLSERLEMVLRSEFMGFRARNRKEDQEEEPDFVDR